MFAWLKRIADAISDDEGCSWEVEPHLTSNIETLFKVARREGDALLVPRVIRCILTFPTFELATEFRDKVPAKWKTKVGKRTDTDDWQCECERYAVPDASALIIDTRILWCLALDLHPVLWAYSGMYDDTGESWWCVAGPILDYREDGA